MAEHQEIQASPEEARFLRRFVRRTTLPWFACVASLAALALGVALSPAPPAAPTALVPSGGHDSADHEDLRAEIAKLREELASLRAAEPGRAAQPDDLEPRLARLEAELASRPATAAASASPSSEDLVIIRDRVYALESRLYDVERTLQAEARRDEPRGSAPLPAAPAAPAP